MPFKMWMGNLWDKHTMESYLVIKGNKLLVHATSWVNLKIIILSEKSETKSVYKNLENANYSDRKQVSGCLRSVERGGREGL